MKIDCARVGVVMVACVVVAGCGGNTDTGRAETLAARPASLPQLAAAEPASLVGGCSALASFAYDATTIETVSVVAEGELAVAGSPIRAHCLVQGRMNERTSAVDGQSYAISFEMRLPMDWNGRFYHQGNGGTDGAVRPAVGGAGGGRSNALHQGFAVISSDAGHNESQNPLFGLDPQARVDYGYGAVQTLTPMAKAFIRAAYGKGPDRSYFGGASNGGRHAMVAAARFADQYDGILAISPGFNLPLAAGAQLYSAQQFHKVATDPLDLSTAFTEEERATVAGSILTSCDGLDGLADGIVQDIEACRAAFSLVDDVPTCAEGRDGSCLTAIQKSAIDAMYQGPVNSQGDVLYATQPYDPGLVGNGWAGWKFTSSVGDRRDPVAVGIIFQVPPDASIMDAPRDYAFTYDFDVDFPRLLATDSTYVEDSLSFMTPPDPTDLSTLRDRGGKMIVVQGASDGVFSIDDTMNWYDGLNQANDGEAAAFARFFRVPGMNHVSGGPATDQYDALAALVDWVEHGIAPDQIVATARGAGNPGGENPAVPADWAPDRTRPLCPYPLVARYNGSGDVERAENFTCR